MVTLRGDELAPAGAAITTLRRAAREFWRSHIKGSAIEHPTLGRIDFTSKGERKFFATSANPGKLRFVPVLPHIVSSADVVKSEPARSKGPNDNVVAYHWLEAAVELGGQSLRLGVTVFEDNVGNKFYNLNTAIKNDEDAQLTRPDNVERNASPRKDGEPSRESTVPHSDDGSNLTIVARPPRDLSGPGAQERPFPQGFHAPMTPLEQCLLDLTETPVAVVARNAQGGVFIRAVNGALERLAGRTLVAEPPPPPCWKSRWETWNRRSERRARTEPFFSPPRIQDRRNGGP